MRKYQTQKRGKNVEVRIADFNTVSNFSAISATLFVADKL